MRTRLLALAAAALAACSTLPDVPVDTCGNGVVEAEHGEDRDRPGDDCGAPGGPATSTSPPAGRGPSASATTSSRS